VESNCRILNIITDCRLVSFAAVGVTTCDERHVFGSFMSREAAFRLMLSVWRSVVPIEEPIAQKLPDVEISECSIEEDSSCSISGNESSSQVKEKKSELIESDSIPKILIPATVTESAKIILTGEQRHLANIIRPVE
jgi:hypothetical protein